MNRNNSDNNTEAVKIANSLKPFVKKWFDEWGQSCVRSKKMTVTTAPNGSVIGVTDAFSDSEILIKYMSSCSNAVVGDTVWVKWMYDNMQTLYADRIGNFDRDNYVPVSGGTFTGDVEFEGSVDIVPRRCTAGLSSAGWYRVMHYDGMYADDAKGGSGFIIDINIARNFYHENNETHSIKLMGVFNTIRFMNEVSNSATVDIDKIRWTYNGADAYVDIHYNSNNLNGVAVSFNVESFPDVCKRITAESLQSVADAPVGETILSTYTFTADRTACSFGTPVTISTFPYTVNEDGFMWVEMRCSSTGRFYTNFPGVFICDGYTASGAYMNGTFPVKKGTTLPTPDEINVSSVKYRWYPL